MSKLEDLRFLDEKRATCLKLMTSLYEDGSSFDEILQLVRGTAVGAVKTLSFRDAFQGLEAALQQRFEMDLALELLLPLELEHLRQRIAHEQAAQACAAASTEPVLFDPPARRYRQQATVFSENVAEFLDLERDLGRRFREETVTDMLMGLLSTWKDWVTVTYPDEPQTGADMEWNFSSRKGRQTLRLFVQAKRATPDERAAARCKWVYKHLNYDRGNQLRTLMKHASTDEKSLAMYALYHPHSIIDRSGKMCGINFMPASAIAASMQDGNNYDFGNWVSRFIALSDLFPFDSLYLHKENVFDADLRTPVDLEGLIDELRTKINDVSSSFPQAGGPEFLEEPAHGSARLERSPKTTGDLVPGVRITVVYP